jgi:signal transduction histidine kinase
MASAALPSTVNTVKPTVPQVPFERVVSMVRHLTHDARNGLNSVDLQAAYVAELVTGEEAVEEVRRLRSMIAGTSKLFQSLSNRFWVASPQLVTYSARIFMQDFRDRLRRLLPDKESDIVWTEDLSEDSIRVDVEMFFSALSEFFKNAFDFRENGRTIHAHVGTKDGRFVLELREGKLTLPQSVDLWGAEPLLTTRRAGYGLGLYYARQVLALHGAELHFAHDPAAGELITRIKLPLSPT